MKFIDNPKAYAKKQIRSTVKTAKGSAVPLVAGLFSILSNAIQNDKGSLSQRMDPTANVLNVVGQGLNLWDQAKGARKAQKNRQHIAGIVSDRDMSDDDKFVKLIELGDFKTANSLNQLRMFNKTFGLKQDEHEERKTQNAVNNEHWDKSFNTSNEHFDRNFDNDNKHFDKKFNFDSFWKFKDFDNNNEHFNRKLQSNTENAIINAVGKGVGGGVSPKNIMDMLNMRNMIGDLDVKPGFLGAGSRKNLPDAKYLTPDQIAALQKKMGSNSNKGAGKSAIVDAIKAIFGRK
jgi:hypothetical protein